MLKHLTLNLLLFGSLLASESVLAAERPKDKDAFTDAWLAYSKSYTKLNEVNEEFTRQITPHMATFTAYKNWMEDITKRLSSSDLKALDIDLAFKQYRELLKKDTTCSSASLQTLQADLHASLRALKKDLIELRTAAGQTAPSNAKLDKGLKKQIQSSVAEAEKATAKAEEAINSYSDTLGSSNICTTLSNFDLILVSSETLLASRKTQSPLQLSSYLNNAQQQKDKTDIKKDALAYLAAVEESFVANLNAGEVAKSLMLLNRLDGNIAFGVSAAKNLPEADRLEVESVKNDVKGRIQKASAELSFPKFEGLLQMVNTKAKLTHELLTDVERAKVRASDQTAFSQLKDFCMTQFHMNTDEPQPPLQAKNLAEVLELDAQLSEAQVQLRSLENSRELASR